MTRFTTRRTALDGVHCPASAPQRMGQSNSQSNSHSDRSNIRSFRCVNCKTHVPNARRPCQQPPRADVLLGNLPKHPVGGSCAVVGSSDILRMSPRGEEIDSHKFVWRVNNAPTAGWEAAVGRRTSWRVVNHVAIEKWVTLAMNRSIQVPDGDEFRALLCAPNQTEHGCILSYQGKARVIALLPSRLAYYQQQYPSHRVYNLSDALLQYGKRCNAKLKGNGVPSGGFLTVLLALAMCDSVTLYGFWPFCCKRASRASATGKALSRGLSFQSWPSMNYK